MLLDDYLRRLEEWEKKIISPASAETLDQLASLVGIIRNDNESDEELKQRVLEVYTNNEKA